MRLKPFILVSVVLLVLVLAVSALWAQQNVSINLPSCHILKSVISHHSQPAKRKAKTTVFNVGPLALNRMTYTRELKTLRVLDQCVHTCWANAGIAYLEHLISHGNAPVAISANYLIARKIEYDAWRSLYQLEFNPVREGGTLQDVVYVTDRYGLLPEEIYPSPSNINTVEIVSEVNAVLRTFTKWSEKVHRESYMDSGIQAVLQKKQKEVMDAVSAILQQNFGQYPNDFLYKGTKFAGSKDFSKKYIPAGKYRRTDLKSNTQSDMAKIMSKIVGQIDLNEMPVYVGYKHYQSLFRQETGEYLSLTQLPVNDYHVFLNRHGVNNEAQVHAVLIVGYRMDKSTRKITHFKLQNSHGFPPFLHMPVQYFHSFVFFIEEYYTQFSRPSKVVPFVR